ncbi:hypothetical protein [Nocardia sp. NPDC005745]|uniref:DAPG hydrolase family protein n=1 Tax=Nocardia sp. NPDC005745 TaxID=3157061 RepID=UPI0033E82DC4
MSRMWRPRRREVLALGAAAAGGLMLGTTAHAQDTLPARYRGYSPQDWAKPYARFMAPRTIPAPAQVVSVFDGPPTPASVIPKFSALTSDLAVSGYSPVETGYGQTEEGLAWTAVRTEMADVSAEMWDWWFGWHSVESARYKLWHPDAHLYSGVSSDRSAETLSDRAKYIGTTSYVDEYVGAKLQQLAISFLDPVAHGFQVPAGHTVILGRVGSSIAPVDLGWLAHQVRPIPGGAEMRSRFYLNLYGLHAPDPHQAVQALERGAALDPADLVLGLGLARDLLLHCGQEMTHLAGFLPQLYREFALGDDTRTG